MNLSQCRQLEGDGDDVMCVSAPGQGALIAYATLMASIVGWDLRAPGIPHLLYQLLLTLEVRDLIPI